MDLSASAVINTRGLFRIKINSDNHEYDSNNMTDAAKAQLQAFKLLMLNWFTFRYKLWFFSNCTRGLWQ